MKKLLLFVAVMVTMFAYSQPQVSIVDQKMVLSDNGTQTVLAPNGDDASYFWASVSPDGQHIVYCTAHLGTYVCDIHGGNVQCMGRMNAPKWIDNTHVAGMQEFYTGHDEIDHIRYISRDITGRMTRDLNPAERTHFIQTENARIVAEKTRQAQRIAARAKTASNGLAGLKIYINPGHGGHDANDRSCWTIPIPETWTNPNGYWESNSNLVKGLALRDLLESAGATVIMSRVTNKSGIRDLEYYPGATPEQLEELRNGDDRDLSAIAEEANANNVDHFISVHSNALNSQTNYLLLLYHGETGAPTVAQSDLMAASSGAIQIQNPLTVWTSSAPLLRGDLTFYGDDMGLGVLRPLTVPGFLSEGSFHDYPPETHRLMNADYCKLEALRMYQHFHKYFQRALPQTATISGWVKSSNEKVDVLNQPKFVYVGGSDDQWLPLNGATVELMQDNTVLQTATTDDWYNGVFAFYDLLPGTYTLRITKTDYKTVEEEVTVAAEEIAGIKVRMKNIHLNPDNYPEPELDVMAMDSYDFEVVDSLMPYIEGLERFYYRNGRIFTLENGALFSYATDWSDRIALPMPESVTLCDFAFASDDYLFAKETGSTNIYMWDDEQLNPELSTLTAAAASNHIVISGPHWNATLLESTSMITLAIDGTAFAADHQAAFLRYAKHQYRVDVLDNAGAVQYKMMDITATATDASQPQPATPLTLAANGFAGAIAWVEGYDIHVMLAVEGAGMLHMKTITSPVLNIYAGECKFAANKFSFRLNEDATSVTLAIESEGETTATHDCGALEKGLHEIDNPFGAVEFDAFSITASGRQIPFVTKVSDDSHVFQYYAPRGVAIDKTPSSPFFGRIYVTESVGGQCSEDWYGTSPDQRAVTQGVYVLGNDLSDVTNQGATAWAGNVAWGTNSGGTYQFALSRPAVAPDGDVFVCSSSYDSPGIYIMNPADPSADFQAVFSGKISASNGQMKKGKNVICNPVMNCVVLGTGENEVLYTYDRNNALGTVYSDIQQYNIGELEALPWTEVPTRKFFDDMTTGSHMQNGNGQIAYDQHGGFFLSQYRYNSSAAVPGLIHVNQNGEVDFNIANNGVDACQQGGMGVSADGSLLAMGTELGQVKVWDVTYDAVGAPTLTEKYLIVWGNAGNTYGVDFDVAGNLYIVSNSNERLMVYALPNLNNVYTTRIITKQKGSGIDEVIKTRPDNAQTHKVMHHGTMYIIRQGNMYNAQGARVTLH